MTLHCAVVGVYENKLKQESITRGNIKSWVNLAFIPRKQRLLEEPLQKSSIGFCIRSTLICNFLNH